MFADLDRQIEESNPDRIFHKIDELNKKDKKLDKQLNLMMGHLAQKEKKANEEESAALIALFDELLANGKEELALLRQHRIVAQQNNILKYKREYLVELLQTMHTMRQEGVWEKVGGKEESIPKKPAKTAQRKRPIATKQSQSGVSSAQTSVTPAQIYERQTWIRLLVSAHRYSSYFQDSLGEVGVFVYDKGMNPSQATLHLWANGTKQQFPVLGGTISQHEMLTGTMRSWLALAWETATGRG